MPKYVLPPFKMIDAGAMSADVTSSPTNIALLDNVGVQLVWTGTPTGTFSVEVSADYNAYLNTGTWIALTLSSPPAATGGASSAFVNMTGLSAPWIRTKYTRTSGTGTLNGWIVGKQA